MNAYGTLTTPDTLRFERLLPGPIERVWSYLTDSEKRRQWLAAGVMEPHNGGHVELIFRNQELAEDGDLPPPQYASAAGEFRTTGEITEFEPPHRLSYIWIENTEVCFELSQEQNKVKLVLIHKRVENPGTLLSVSGGWHTHLDLLVNVISEQKPESFWKKFTRLNEEYQKILNP